MNSQSSEETRKRLSERTKSNLRVGAAVVGAGAFFGSMMALSPAASEVPPYDPARPALLLDERIPTHYEPSTFASQEGRPVAYVEQCVGAICNKYTVTLTREQYDEGLDHIGEQVIIANLGD